MSGGENGRYIQKQMGHSSFQISINLYGYLMEEVHEGAERKSEDFFCYSHTVNEKGATNDLQLLELI